MVKSCWLIGIILYSISWADKLAEGLTAAFTSETVSEDVFQTVQEHDTLDVAYIIYTDGSFGNQYWGGAVPEGVQVQRALVTGEGEYTVGLNFTGTADGAAKGIMLGAFVDGKLAGFMGQHPEGSLGMLFVFPQFRRQGIAEALERNYVNLELAQGHVPYGQIFVGNTASRMLQEKLGMEFSEGNICWCGKI